MTRMTRTRPIDPGQHVWWHRVRRWGPWKFTLLGGGVIMPLITCLLFLSVLLYYGYPMWFFAVNGAIMWAATAPLYMGCFFWTWKHMERRYRATLLEICPGCGYSLRGSAGRPCPECGWRA